MAEMGSCFTLATLGVPRPMAENSTAYVANWLEALNEDSRFIFRAASAAQRRPIHLFVRSRKSEPEPVEVAF